MPEDDADRQVVIYFGPSPHTMLLKDTVAKFLMEEMGLVRSDGGPKWTDGLTTLIEMGMDAWEERQKGNQTDFNVRFDELERQIEKIHEEIKSVSVATDERPWEDDLVKIAKRVYRTEARILKVLNREENMGAKSPNFVNVTRVSETTGLDRKTVGYYANILLKLYEGIYIEFDYTGKKIRAAEEDAFDTYCRFRGLDPASL